MNELELYSFELDEHVFHDVTVYKMDLPYAWSQYLESVRFKPSHSKRIYPTVIGKKLQAIMPSIFHVDWKGHLPWLLCEEKVDGKIIKALFLNWLAINESCMVEELNPSLKNVELEWEPILVSDLLKKQNSLKFSCIPSLMARRFAKEVNQVEIEGGFSGELKLKHTLFNGVNECVSIPVSETTANKAFSYVFRFTYKTRGLMPESGILNVSIGTRRYLQKPVTKAIGISPRRKGSVLLGLKNPFESNSEIKSYMQLEYERDNDRLLWTKNVDEKIMETLNLSLDIESILADPQAYQYQDDYELFVVYSDTVFTSKINLSGVDCGIGLPEKSQLFTIVKETFNDLKPLDKCPELKVKNKEKIGGKVLPLQHYDTSLHKLIIECWFKTFQLNEFTERLIKEEIILLDPSTNKYFLHSNVKTELVFIQRDATEIVKEVDNYQQFVREIEGIIEKDETSQTQVISLIEIEEKSSWKGKKDPKEALRKAFFKKGRLTQFIYPATGTDNNTRMRQVNSFFDLMTDLGFLPARTERFRENYIMLSLSYINIRNKMIIPFATKYFNKKLTYRVFGTSEWRTLKETIQYVLEDHKEHQDKYKDKEKINSFYERVINNELAESKEDIIVIADSKIRNRENKLVNDQLKLDEIPFDIHYEEDLERIKVVRMNNTEEVPQYRINPKGRIKVNRNQGIFKGPSGMYYCVGSRPDSMRNLPIGVQRYKTPQGRLVKRRNSELIVLGARSEEERDEIALLVNQLRLFTIAYNNHTILPYPIHMLKAVLKYVKDQREITWKASISTEEELMENILINDEGQLELDI